jgi:hypothetical protein
VWTRRSVQAKQVKTTTFKNISKKVNIWIVEVLGGKFIAAGLLHFKSLVSY